MKKKRKNFGQLLNSAVFLKKLHGVAAIAWLIWAVAMLFKGTKIHGLQQSIPYVVFISHYAIVTGHWSSWQSGRTEEKQDIQAESVQTETISTRKLKVKKN